MSFGPQIAELNREVVILKNHRIWIQILNDQNNKRIKALVQILRYWAYMPGNQTVAMF